MAKLTEREKQEIKEFTELVKKKCGKEINFIKLYGSAVRNNLRRDSDIDVLIVSKKRSLDLREKIFDIVTQIAMKYDRILTPKIIDEKRFRYLNWLETPFMMNVKKEGVILWRTNSKSR
ncbi:MAG: nucleotidyltransferase domain-containing protein [Elusimicrobiota bacterium]